MAKNRWIGQALPVQEVKYFTPGTIVPGAKFQLSDGRRKLGYAYPPVQPEKDVTDYDKALRVVEAIVAAASETPTLGGGATPETTYAASSYNGQPAVKVVGATDGRPVDVVASASAPELNAVRVQRMQEGTTGVNFVYSLKWPVTPTAGTWPIAANGQKPLRLAYNISAADLRTALLTFDLHCSDVTVTGSHSAGYVLTFVDPDSYFEDPPLLFPIIPGVGARASVTFEMFEDHSYRFGPESGYAGAGEIIEASVTEEEFLEYLADTIRLGETNASNVEVTITQNTAVPSWIAGVSVELVFNTDEAYDAWVAMEKKQYNFTWAEMEVGTVSGGFLDFYLLATYPTSTTWSKIRQRPHPRTISVENLNPYNRKYCTVAGKSSDPPEDWILDVPVPGNNLSMVTPRPHTVTAGASDYTSDVDVAWTSEAATAWTISESQITVELGEHTETVDLEVTTLDDGFGSELGVDNNAGYKCETIAPTGIISQELLLPALDGDINSLYYLQEGTRKSHKFGGVASLTFISDAAGALWGAGNVTVGASDDPAYSARIHFHGELAEREVTVTLVQETADGGTVSVDVEATTPMQAWVLKYSWTGGVCAGTWKFTDGTTEFRWIRPTAITAAEIYAAILEVAPEYSSVLEEEDIEVEIETVGRQSVLRSFTITWQAQPSASSVGSADIGFWLGVDTDSLLTAEPVLSMTTAGKAAKHEIQVVSLENSPSSGTWQLTYGANVSSALAYNASAGSVQTAVSAISSACTVIGGNGGPYRIKWDTVGPRMTLVGENLTLTVAAAPTFQAVTATAGTGPKHYDNQDNWSLGVVPGNDDDIVFSDGSVDCCYGLTNSATPRQIDTYRSYTGKIGLPEIRDDGTYETLPLWLTFTGTSVTPLVIRIGLGESGEGPSTIRIATENRAFDGLVLHTQTGLFSKVAAFKCDTESQLVCVKGDIAAGVRPEDECPLTLLQITPSADAGDELIFSSSESSTITSCEMLGGTAQFGKPPLRLNSQGGGAVINGDGDCDELDAGNVNIRWLANGTLGVSGVAEEVLFGAGHDDSATSPSSVRIVSTAHGLESGERVYLRSYSGVRELDRKVASVTVVDDDTFDLVGVLAQGTLLGYEGLVKWAVERKVTLRENAVLSFDSDGRVRDIVAPIVMHGNAVVQDAKQTVVDLRMWPESQASGNLGQAIELRRVKRGSYAANTQVAEDGGISTWTVGGSFVVG